MDETKGDEEKSSWKQEQFIAALLSHATVEAAAKAIGIAHVTAWRWRNDPAFHERYRKATRDAMREAAARLQSAAREAVDTLRKIQSEGQSESARVSAARIILNMALRAADLEDVQRRLDALEQALEERTTE